MPFAWSDQYATGVEDIDNQHKKLFELINQIEDELDRTELDERRVKRIITFLGLYTKSHFGYEEDCMFRHKCPLYTKNKDAHTKFLDFYKDVKKESEEEGVSKSLLKKLHDTAENWLVNHIGKIDTHLRDCLS